MQQADSKPRGGVLAQGLDDLPARGCQGAGGQVVAEAHRLATSSRMSMTLLRRGLHIPVPPIEKAERFLAGRDDSDERGSSGRPRRAVLGSPDTVRAGLEAVAAEYGAEEVIVVGITYDHAARRHSYELIAEAFGLCGARPGPHLQALG